jgi:hypothetical protein
MRRGGIEREIDIERRGEGSERYVCLSWCKIIIREGTRKTYNEIKLSET